MDHMETGGHGICLSQGIRQQMPKPRDRAASAETQAGRTRNNVGRSLRCGSGVSAAVASVPRGARASRRRQRRPRAGQLCTVVLLSPAAPLSGGHTLTPRASPSTLV